MFYKLACFVLLIPSTTGIREEIRSRNEEFMKKFSAKDVNGCAELYCQDCKFMPHGKDVAVGKEAVKKYYQQDMDEGVSNVTMITEEVSGAGEWAFERGTYKLDGSRGLETGVYLMVWKKVEGKWCIYSECFNVVHPAQGLSNATKLPFHPRKKD